jgi:hypothetical protein
VISALVLILGLLLQTPQVPAGKLEGTVVRIGSKEPIEGAQIVLARIDAASTSSGTSATAASGEEGRFTFENVAPGSYRVLVAANGYVRQQYGQRVFPGAGSPIRMDAGQAIQSIVVEMSPAAIVTGRILDNDRRPTAAVPVRLMRFLYDESGARSLRVYGTAQTDDRGDYRISFVTPGRYYVHAGTAQSALFSGEQRLGPNERQQVYSDVYYPGVAEISLATPVEVRPGMVAGGLDFSLVRRSFHTIRGRIIDTTTGQPPASPALSLFFFNAGAGRAVANSDRNRQSYTNTTGAFEIRDVPPGAYTMASSEKPNTSGNQLAMRFGFTRVDVTNSDVDNVIVTIPAGASISGRIMLEGQTSPMAAFQEGYVRFVRLVRTANGIHPSMPRDWEAGTRVAEDGAFRFDGVTAGEYRIAIQGLDPSHYIKEARYGPFDVLNAPLQFKPDDVHRLEIVLSPRTGSVEGVVTDGLASVSSAAQVVLVPDRNRDRPELFRTAIADQNGRFKVSGVPPGNYKVFAWEAIELYSWFDPEILARDDARSKAIRMEESSNLTIDVPVIPAR